MKNMKNLFTLCFLFFLSTLTGKTTDPKKLKDTTECLSISGKIENIAGVSGPGIDNTYQVELIYYNTVINSVTKKKDKHIQFILKKNSMYTIRISKKGYITKLVSINTSLESGNDQLYSFHFDTPLFEEDLKRVLDEEAL